MKIKRRYLGLVIPLVSVLVAVAFTPISGKGTNAIHEPLSLTSAAITGGNCTFTAATFSCESDAFAGETGTVDVTIANAANVQISITTTATSDDPTNVQISSPSAVIPATGSAVVTFTFTASQSTPPETVTFTFSVSR